MLYNDAYGPLIGKKHPGALGCAIREVLPETWDFLGPRFDNGRRSGGQPPDRTDVHRLPYNYLEECYFSFSYSPIRDDNGSVGGVLTTVRDMTERMIEDRRKQVLRDLASRIAEARLEAEVWRVSTESLGQHRSTIPFAFLYEYRPVERQAHLASASVEADDLHPMLIDCNAQNIWPFDTALPEDCLIVDLGQRAGKAD
jgi:hypothetical protein